MRKEVVRYKVYDTQEKDYVYKCTQYGFKELSFESIKEARDYFEDKVRYEIHKFKTVVSSDQVNCDPPTEEDFKLKEKKLKKEVDYAKRNEEYLSKFNPRDDMKKEMLRLQFAINESLEEIESDTKKNLCSFCAQPNVTETQKEINSLVDLLNSIEENYFKYEK